MDPLTDLFTATHVASLEPARTEVTAPGALIREERPVHGPYAYAYFAHVAHGQCYLTLGGRGDAIPLAIGDCILLAPNTDFALRTGRAPTTIISASFALDRWWEGSLSDVLPSVIHVRTDLERTPALTRVLAMLTSELASPGPGSSVVVARLADILFIESLRAHVAAGHCTERPRWLRALADPHIGRSLAAMHGAVDRPWTLASLAAAAGMSRSAFAARFKAIVGETPLQYLTRWRMQTAGRLVRAGERKMSAIARAVGYRADAAFTRAFRRVHGSSPSAYRRTVPGLGEARHRSTS
jgi:AraC-like DNA-binding protein